MIGERLGPLDVTGAEGDVAVASDINGGVSGAVEFGRGGSGEIDERAGVVGRGDGGGAGGGVGGESGDGFAGERGLAEEITLTEGVVSLVVAATLSEVGAVGAIVSNA